MNDRIIYIGVNDKEIDLFEGLYEVPNGMAYNSYIVLDDKIAIMDTVEAKFGEEWLKNIEKAIGDKAPDYLIVHHMEPDHSANIGAFLEKYPNATVVATDKAFSMMEQFFKATAFENRITVKEGDTLSLGKGDLTFYVAPMVHWPEVMVSYDKITGTLFSADAFGKFGALDTSEDWACEARRYYFGIVGKYGPQAKTLLNKLKGLEVKRICPLHGPILEKDIEYYINLYNIWATYEPECKGVFIAYTSVYGNTKKAALQLYNELVKRNVKVAICDLAREDKYEAIEDAFKYDKMVLASTTYNTELFPPMREFLNELVLRNYQNRKIGIIENGTWAPMVAKKIMEKLEKSKNIEYCENSVVIKSALTNENEQEIIELATELCK